MNKKPGRKPKKTGITLQLDPELYQFFSAYAEQERSTMAGILRQYVLELKRRQEQAPAFSTMPDHDREGA